MTLTHQARHRITHSGVLCLILLLFAALTSGSKDLSLTSDEPPHIAHGYLMLRTADTWALSEHRHPPLLNMWSAWPLLLQPEQPDPRQVPGWSTDFVIFVRNLWPLLGPVDRLAYLTRLPGLLLCVLLAALVSRWAKEMGGGLAAGLAVAVMVFDPTLVGHAQLATTDVGVTLFSFAALYLAARWRPERRRTLLLGLVLGAALASKGSGVILLPVVALALGVRAWKGLEHRPPAAWAGTIAGLLGLSLITLWASYGFRIEPVPWAALQLPLVRHIEVVRLILSEKSRTAFLAGQVRQGGWWWYFPFAFVVKTPLPMIALLAAALVHLFAGPRRLRDTVALWLYPAVHLATAIASGMNIGYRHLLPAFPFGYVAIAVMCRAALLRHPSTPRSTRGARFAAWGVPGLLAGLLLWLAVEAAAVHPYGLAYFNQLVGGSKQGYRYLVDSNLDWGQSFTALARHMDRQGIASVHLSYYTWIDPALYGVRYDPLPPARDVAPGLERRFDPLPGAYALSATPLQGVMMADPDTYAWFRQRVPDAQPGYGLLLYTVKPHPVTPGWIAQCTQPTPPLSAEAVSTGLGRTDLREIGFDCTSGWILPEGGSTPGWYAVHGALRGDAFVEAQAHHGQALLSYRQRAPHELPAFDLYWQPQTTAGPRITLDPPVDFGALSLLGHSRIAATIRRGQALEIETWWRVSSVAPRPLSLMFHLGKPGEPPLATSDGLAVPVEVWRQGDILVQRHRLEVPEEAAPGSYAITSSVYWLDTLERWSIRSGNEAGSDAVILAPVEIRR